MYVWTEYKSAEKFHSKYLENLKGKNLEHS